MLPDYKDITDIAGTPLWWDGEGVPRYQPFEPRMLGVYDDFALLVRIECQSCRKPMLVGCGWTKWGIKHTTSEARRDGDRRWDIEIYTLEMLAENFRFSDPPRHNCGGDSMNSAAMAIEQAWKREKLTWVRDPEVEKINVRPDWDTDEH